MSTHPARLVLLGVAATYAVGLGLFLLFRVRDVLILIFLAWILAAALRPPVDRLGQRLPRALAIAIVYLAVLSVFVGLSLLVVPPLVREMVGLSAQLPLYLSQIQEGLGLVQGWFVEHGLVLDVSRSLSQAIDAMGRGLGSVLLVPLAAARLTISFFAVVVISFYWLLLRASILDWAMSFVPEASRGRARSMFEEAEGHMGAYVRGLVFLGLVVGALTLAGLTSLGVPFALALAVLAGVLELLPNIGPVISAVPAMVLALALSPLHALAVAGLYTAVQQLENYLLVPKVQEKAVGLNPLAILVAVLLGGTLAGIAGALLAVPVAALVNLLIKELRRRDA
ncbi:MAG: AI-2E family transporter [Chloroflexi bacterium]|nr:AI-2E family transporter [Chloroflexota bacterium]